MRYRLTPSTTFLMLIISSLILIDPAMTAETQPVSGKIEAVTVYSDRALVRRSHSIKLGGTQTTVRFVELPVSLIPDTIRASATGVTIASISVRPSNQMEDSVLEEHPLKKRIEELNRSIRSETDRLTNYREQLKTLNSFAHLTTTQTDREMRAGAIQVNGWMEAMKYMEDRRLDYLQKIQNSELKIADLQKSQKIVSEQFSRIANARKRSPVDVELVCQGKPGATGAIHLDYMVSGVSWKGIYDLHGKSEGGDFRLESIATVRQKTGEDWNDVQVTLSTARPSLAIAPPTIKPWRVSPGSLSMNDQKPTDALASDDEESTGKPTSGESSASDAAEVSTFTVQLPGLESIPSDNSDHRVTMQTATITGTVSHVAIPSRTSFVFLKGKFKNTLSMPLLWSTANVYLDGGFVGTTTPGTKASVGEEFEMYLGPDQRMQVKRTLVKGEIAGSGIISQSVEIHNQWQIEISNYTKKSRDVLILDQFPVSVDPRISTKFLGSNRNDVKADTRGILSWTVSVAAGQTQKVDFSYNLSLPREYWTSFEKAEEAKQERQQNYHPAVEPNAPSKEKKMYNLERMLMH
ncbi:MAG: mucoidy inhibitor MuiA family protein [Leptospirales bacterium]|nr:mucoidy inhibitor MuiA family protein [Leptospirales bacterium]